jgi:hypothetical protein
LWAPFSKPNAHFFTGWKLPWFALIGPVLAIDGRVRTLSGFSWGNEAKTRAYT